MSWEHLVLEGSEGTERRLLTALVLKLQSTIEWNKRALT